MQGNRLQNVNGVTLHIMDPESGEQIGIEDHGGHFRGHLDGAILGLLQAPKTWHVWEHKQCGEDKIRKLEKLKTTLGEKQALREWNSVYYEQAQIYMHYTGMRRHYLTAATPGGRRTVSVRTEYCPESALRLVEKARAIIFAASPPERLSVDPAYFECRWCPHSEHCHGNAMPLRSCRTCAFATPEADGSWQCSYHEKALSVSAQREGCPDHRYIPAVVPGRQEDAAQDGSWISYELRDGRAWVDEGPQASAAPYDVTGGLPQ